MYNTLHNWQLKCNQAAFHFHLYDEVVQFILQEFLQSMTYAYFRMNIFQVLWKITSHNSLSYNYTRYICMLMVMRVNRLDFHPTVHLACKMEEANLPSRVNIGQHCIFTHLSLLLACCCQAQHTYYPICVYSVQIIMLTISHYAGENWPLLPVQWWHYELWIPEPTVLSWRRIISADGNQYSWAFALSLATLPD